jgi:aminoglycoside/choline kinase family phosphotransferase
VSLPDRFRPLIQQSLDSLPAIFSLPMVLLHRDFGICNIMVNEDSCHLVGVVDWAESEITPFGLNLYSIQQLISTAHLKDGWMRYGHYAVLEDAFWSTFSAEAGGLAQETVEIVKAARVMGLLLSRGFTSRLANMPEPVPVRDDEGGAYNIRDLDGLLINPATRFTELV